MNYLVAELPEAIAAFGNTFRGNLFLIHDGEILEANVAQEHVSMDELERSLREHGISTYKQAALATLEVGGSISVLKYDDIERTASAHLNRRRCLKEELRKIRE